MSNNGRRLSHLPPPDDLAGVAIPAEAPGLGLHRAAPPRAARAGGRRFWRGLAEGLLVAALFTAASLTLAAAGAMAWMAVDHARAITRLTVATNGLIDRQAQTQALLVRGGLAQSSDFLSSPR